LSDPVRGLTFVMSKRSSGRKGFMGWIFKRNFLLDLEDDVIVRPPLLIATFRQL
jgi:hypothetical protein